MPSLTSHRVKTFACHWLVNAKELDERDIDGGVFHKFLSELLKTGFDPNHGYFATTQERHHFPNTQAQGEQIISYLPFSQSYLCTRDVFVSMHREEHLPCSAS